MNKENIKDLYLKLSKNFKSKNNRYFYLIGFLCFIGLLIESSNKSNPKYIAKDKKKFSKERHFNNQRNIYKRKEKLISKDFEKLKLAYKKDIDSLKSNLTGINDSIKKLNEKLNQSKNESSPPADKPKPPKEKDPQVEFGYPGYGSSAQVVEDNKPNIDNRNIGSSYGSTKTKYKPKVPDVISFPVKASEKTIKQIAIPPGSFLKAKLLVGVQATENKPVPALLLAEEVFIGPNKTRIDLTGCFLIAKSSGNLSIERVEMQATKITCVSKEGRMFERDMNGFVADKLDGSFALRGEIKSRQGRAAALGFLSAVVQGVGNAIQNSQTSQTTTPLGGSNSIVTGDQTKHMIAGGLSNAAGKVTDWYLRQAQGLMPYIQIKSGQSIFVITQETIKLPNWYFNEKKQMYDKEYSYVSSLYN